MYFNRFTEPGKFPDEEKRKGSGKEGEGSERARGRNEQVGVERLFLSPHLSIISFTQFIPL